MTITCVILFILSSCQFSLAKFDDIAVVITVSGALQYYDMCVFSLRKYSPDVFVIAVDDSPNDDDSVTLHSLMANSRMRYTVVPKLAGRAVGFTLAVNAGIREALKGSYSFIVSLNSDTVVTPFWVEGLRAALHANASLGAVGPLGNAASYQSVPSLSDSSGAWSLNHLPPGWTPEKMARTAFLLSNKSTIDVPILNGFCIMFKRQLFEQVGLMDEELFPSGFGEENDFAFRATDAGHRLAVVPSVYVYHFKSKSYGVEKRKDLASTAAKVLTNKYGDRLKQAVKSLVTNSRLAETRETISNHLETTVHTMAGAASALFFLNIMPKPKQFLVRGGWISLVQEAIGLAKNNVYTRIAVQMWTLPHFASNFPEANSVGIFWGFESLTPNGVADELIAAGMLFDFVIATHFSTVDTVLAILQKQPGIIPSYYVQDIESTFDGAESERVQLGYQAMGNGFTFAKTQWLQHQLKSQFGVQSHLIPPTVDRALFRELPRKGVTSPLRLCSMVRVETPRRQPVQTVEVLEKALHKFGRQVSVVIFGSNLQSIEGSLIAAGSKADTSKMIVLGPLSRQDVAELFAQCDVFLDLSEWQAFGRSGLEAMSSGCVPILPIQGGARQYARNGVNSFVIDTRDQEAADMLLEQIVNNRFNLSQMRSEAIATAESYSIPTSARATAGIFMHFAKQWKARVL